MAGVTQRRPLTARQRSVLELIMVSTERAGRPPTLRELGEQLGISSTNGVRDHLQALIDKGYLRRDGHSARGLHVVHQGGDVEPSDAASRHASGAQGILRVPVLGRVAAGAPLLADQNINRYLSLDASLFRGAEQVFGLRVRGDSMRDAGIFEGDYVLVRQQATADARDVVVALIDDETTVKRYVPAGLTIRLEPANPSYRPIILRRDDPRLIILGKVSAVLRTM